MKKFKSEFAHSYSTYSFGYSNYIERERKDILSEIYEEGYLPYSGTPLIKDTLYMARSARIPLNKFELNSENRRVARKFDGIFSKKIIPLKSFRVDKKFIDFCTDYFEKRHGPNVMPPKRLLTILGSRFMTNIIEYKNKEKIVAYVFLVRDKKMSHYWYSFYDLDLVFKSLGLWIIIDAIRDAKKEKRGHFYLGTVYDEKALYKTNFDHIEFWNGNKWISDRKKLRRRSRDDSKRNIDLVDEWKEDKDIF